MPNLLSTCNRSPSLLSSRDIVAKTFEYMQPKSDIGYMLSKVGTPSITKIRTCMNEKNE